MYPAERVEWGKSTGTTLHSKLNPWDRWVKRSDLACCHWTDIIPKCKICMHQMSAAESYLVGTKCSPFAWCHCHGLENPVWVEVGVNHWNLQALWTQSHSMWTSPGQMWKITANIRSGPSCWDCRTVLVHVYIKYKVYRTEMCMKSVLIMCKYL